MRTWVRRPLADMGKHSPVQRGVTALTRVFRLPYRWLKARKGVTVSALITRGAGEIAAGRRGMKRLTRTWLA